MRKTGLPVVYLANDYSKDEEPKLNVSAFEEWDYNDYNKKKQNNGEKSNDGYACRNGSKSVTL